MHYARLHLSRMLGNSVGLNDYLLKCMDDEGMGVDDIAERGMGVK